MPTFSGDTADGYLRSEDATYATARSGAVNLTSTTGSIVEIGQTLAVGSYRLFEAFFYFDTSSLDDSETIGSAVLALRASSDTSTQDFTLQARSYAWSAGGLTSGDWIAGASLGANTLLATAATSTYPGDDTYWTFTSEAVFPSAVNRTGLTEIVIASDRLASGSAPADGVGETVILYSAQDGDGFWPTLTVMTVDVNPLRIVVPAMRW